MSAIPYWHVDAFAGQAFAGNPAGVMQLEGWLTAGVMQAIAREIGLPATAFVVEDDGAQLRWFSPSAELRLCGHGTLAAGHVMLARSGADLVTFRTQTAGEVQVRRAPAGYELALPAISCEPIEAPLIAALLGGEPRELRHNPAGYTIARYSDEAAIRALAPDLAALVAGTESRQFICTAPGEHADVVSRVFVAGPDGKEDSVTGSAHAALAPFWTARLGRDSFTAHQASARGGDLTCRLEGDRVWIGGQCTTLVEGTFYLSG